MYIAHESYYFKTNIVHTAYICVCVFKQSDLFSLSRLSEMGSCKLNIPVPDPKLFNHEVLLIHLSCGTTLVVRLHYHVVGMNVLQYQQYIQ